tara:strand:+ start:9334 stop:10272 length:939 start_codon:yes stop_codon:yes gene_type:complete
MKVLIATVCNDLFVPGSLTLLQSLKNNVSNIDNYDVKIYYHDELCKLSDVNKSKFKKVFPRIKFHRVELPISPDLCIADSEDRRSAFIKLECFNEEEYDRVVFLDSDAIVINDITDVIEDESIKFGYVAGNDRWSREDGPFQQANTGVLFVGKEYLSGTFEFNGKNQRLYEHCFDCIVSKIGTQRPSMMEQNVINTVMSGYHSTALPSYYNHRIFKTCGNDRGIDITNTKVIHWCMYWRYKPWVTSQEIADCASFKENGVVGYPTWEEEVQKYNNSVSHMREQDQPNFIFNKYLEEVNDILSPDNAYSNIKG